MICFGKIIANYFSIIALKTVFASAYRILLDGRCPVPLQVGGQQNGHSGAYFLVDKDKNYKDKNQLVNTSINISKLNINLRIFRAFFGGKSSPNFMSTRLTSRKGNKVQGRKSQVKIF